MLQNVMPQAEVSMMDKVPCRICGKKVLSATIRRTDGLCMPCYQGPNPKSLLERAQDIAVRIGIMEDTDRIEDHPNEALVRDGDQLGRNITEILESRGIEDDFVLVGQLCILLTEKENAEGFDAFSEAEKSAYLVGDMIRQLDSGGFNTYFFNTGHLVAMLSKSLDEIGSHECKVLVNEAISIYGKIPSTDYDQMLAELDKITQNFETNPWQALDDRYFELDENLGKKIMDYVNLNQEQILA